MSTAKRNKTMALALFRAGSCVFRVGPLPSVLALGFSRGLANTVAFPDFHIRWVICVQNRCTGHYITFPSSWSTRGLANTGHIPQFLHPLDHLCPKSVQRVSFYIPLAWDCRGIGQHEHIFQFYHPLGYPHPKSMHRI